MTYDHTKMRTMLWDITALTDDERVHIVPPLDHTLFELDHAGLIDLVIQDTQPSLNQDITVWLDPANPSYSAEGVCKLWDGSAYQTATPALWMRLFQKVGNFPTTTVRTGAGVPANTLGEDGDMYHRTDGDGGIYYKVAGMYTGPLPGSTKAQSDWNELSTTAEEFIQNKPSLALSTAPTPTLVTLHLDGGISTSIPGATSSEAGVMSAADKAKLDTLTVGTQADWNEGDPGSGAHILNKPGLALGVTPNATEAPLTLSGGVGVTLPAATTSLAGLMTAADKTKLDGLGAGGGGSTVIASFDFNGIAASPTINDDGCTVAVNSVTGVITVSALGATGTAYRVVGGGAVTGQDGSFNTQSGPYVSAVSKTTAGFTINPSAPQVSSLDSVGGGFLVIE